MENEAIVHIVVKMDEGGDKRLMYLRFFDDMLKLGVEIEERKHNNDLGQLHFSAACPYDVFMKRIEERLLATKTTIGKKIEDAIGKYKSGIIKITFSNGKVDPISIDHQL